MTKPKSTGGSAIQEVAREVADKWRNLLKSKAGRAVIAAQEAAIAKFGERRFANFFASEIEQYWVREIRKKELKDKTKSKETVKKLPRMQVEAWIAVEMAIKAGHAPNAEKAAHYLEKEDGLAPWIVDGGKHPSGETIRSLHSREANRRKRAKSKPPS